MINIKSISECNRIDSYLNCPIVNAIGIDSILLKWPSKLSLPKYTTNINIQIQTWFQFRYNISLKYERNTGSNLAIRHTLAL